MACESNSAKKLFKSHHLHKVTIINTYFDFEIVEPGHQYAKPGVAVIHLKIHPLKANTKD